jgi:hypothetical protein
MRTAARPVPILLLAILLSGCDAPPRGAVALTPMVRTELYFGLNIPGGGQVDEAAFDAFLRDEVTPRFPDGLTVLAGRGQWRSGQEIVTESSRVLILLHPAQGESARAADAKIEEVRRAYCARFKQEAVLRVDDAVRGSF